MTVASNHKSNYQKVCEIQKKKIEESRFKEIDSDSQIQIKDKLLDEFEYRETQS